MGLPRDQKSLGIQYTNVTDGQTPHCGLGHTRYSIARQNEVNKATFFHTEQMLTLWCVSKAFDHYRPRLNWPCCRRHTRTIRTHLLALPAYKPTLHFSIKIFPKNPQLICECIR